MTEHITKAIILTSKASRDHDRLIDMYTEDLGRVEAKAVGGRKTLSKLNPHLDVGNLVCVRIVKKNQYIIADAQQEDSMDKKSSAVLDLLFLLRNLLPCLCPDKKMWVALTNQVKNQSVNTRVFLKILGYDISEATCGICKKNSITHVCTKGPILTCAFCSRKLPEKILIPLTKGV